MPGRIRTIKPELIEDAVTSGLSHEAFRLFIGMILIADDHGNLRAGGAYLLGQVFHSAPLMGAIGDICDELGRKLVIFYDVDGQRYAHVNGWAKHQRIDNAHEPRVPLPPGWVAERVTKNWGGRARVSWVSRLAGNGAAPVSSDDVVAGSGAAPFPTNATSDEVGAAGSHTSDQRPASVDHAAPPAAASAPPDDLPDLTPEADEVAAELAEGRDIWPDLPDLAIAQAAERIERLVRCDSATQGEHAAALAQEAVSYARSWLAGHPTGLPAQAFAEAERKVGFIVRDYRERKRKRGSAVRSVADDRRRQQALESARMAAAKGAA